MCISDSFHTTQEKSDTTFFKNSTIDARNAEIQKFADNETVFYIDCNPVFDDDTPFDDALRDQSILAAPMLEKYGF